MKRGAVQTKFTVKTPLVALTANEAGRIARSLVSIMMANATAKAAVDELIMTFPALGELDREFKWFRPMMEAIATELMDRVAYGVKARAAIGAGVSFGDMLSDAYMVDLYRKTGRPGTSNSLLGMVGANLVFQLVITYSKCNNMKKDKWKTMLFEFLSIVSFMKPGALSPAISPPSPPPSPPFSSLPLPGVDAFRVASGAETAEGPTMDPLAEMVYTKGGELVFEAVPGLVLQLVAALNAKENTTSVFASLIISTASAALTGTTIVWDLDTDPGKRKRNVGHRPFTVPSPPLSSPPHPQPDWIGLVPDMGRGTAFATVFAMCAFQIFAKAAATALLAATDSAWLWYARPANVRAPRERATLRAY
jgi:hypothetical protein